MSGHVLRVVHAPVVARARVVRAGHRRGLVRRVQRRHYFAQRRAPGRLRIGYSTVSPIKHGTGDRSAAEQRVLGFLHGTGILGVLARLGLPDKTVDRIATDNLRYVPFTQLSNLTGTPAMSVPVHWTAAGLPLGVQFMGPFGSEDRLLQVARQLEEVQPWFDRMPGMARG
jgi:Asp-tRNA(Asn)/Glu-tRNA(Gln) amidotransferase A subunit family amidase